MDDFEQAAECFERALLHTDEHLDMLFEIAYVYVDCDMYGKAIEYFQQIIDIEPSIEQSYYEIANCYDILGQSGKAEIYYNKLIDFDPYNGTAWYNLGIVHSKTGAFEKALEAYDFCLAIDDDFIAARFNKANVLVELERYKDAIAEYLLTIEEDGADSITYCNLGGCYERMDEDLAARDYYKKATELNANIAEAWFGNWTYLRQRKFIKRGN